MKKVLHIEDNSQWRENVRSALALCLDIELDSVGSLQGFRDKGWPYADLYVLDRHLPVKEGEHPNDESWKDIVNTVGACYKDSRIIILSRKPPVDTRKYNQIVKVFNKSNFDSAVFRTEVEKILGIRLGSTVESIAEGYRNGAR